MFKLISVALEKMGNWFGIIFKMIIPFAVMYRPIKTFTFFIVLAGTFCGGDSHALSDMGVIVFGILYGVFALLLIFLPKVASVTEFVLIGFYFAFLAISYIAGFYSDFFAAMSQLLHTYAKALPLVIVFLMGKILFFFFIRTNNESYEKMKDQKNQWILRS